MTRRVLETTQGFIVTRSVFEVIDSCYYLAGVGGIVVAHPDDSICSTCP